MENYPPRNNPRNNSFRPPSLRAIFFVLLLSVISYFAFRHFLMPKAAEEGQPETPAKAESGAAEENIREKYDGRIERYEIVDGDIPADVFSEHGKMDANATEALLKASKDVFDFSHLKIGQELRFFFSPDDKLEKIEYERDTERRIVAEKHDSGFAVREEKVPYEVSQEILKVKINDFLYKDALDAGLSEATVLDIGDIFSFDIDFLTDIRQGDELTVVYEKRKLDGKDAPDGRVLAAKFVNAGQAYYAYYFDNGEGGGHYDPEGHELVKQFLRAPLSYRRISSGYTGARYHPVTKKVSAHYQIDYAAAPGTPVVATARGTVVSAGWEGGWGNMIRLTHDNGFTTHYGHLSGFAKGVRGGVRVQQGQVIGFVGSTGWSTGPHLDYGMRLNGAPVNPLSLNLPKGNPLSGDKLTEFRGKKDEFDHLLDGQ